MVVKFLVIGDLHGSRPEIHHKGFDAIIAPGDFCSSDGIREYMFREVREKLQNPASKVKWHDFTGKNKAKAMIRKSLSDGRKVLEYLNSFGVPVYIVPGNADWTPDKDSNWNFLRQNHYKTIVMGLSNIVDIHNKIADIEDYQLIGHGISAGPEYPQYKQDLARFKPKELAKRKRKFEAASGKVAKLFGKASKPVIFLSHNVPFNTLLDKITNRQSPRYGQHFGSLIAREAIDKYQPLVCIGGHIHEHFGKSKIGKTTVINTGFGPNVNILMELSENKIKKLEFHRA